LLLFLRLESSDILIRYTVVIAFPLRMILRILSLIDELFLLLLMRLKINKLYSGSYVSIISATHV